MLVCIKIVRLVYYLHEIVFSESSCYQSYVIHKKFQIYALYSLKWDERALWNHPEYMYKYVPMYACILCSRRVMCTCVWLPQRIRVLPFDFSIMLQYTIWYCTGETVVRKSGVIASVEVDHQLAQQAGHAHSAHRSGRRVSRGYLIVFLVSYRGEQVPVVWRVDALQQRQADLGSLKKQLKYSALVITDR